MANFCTKCGKRLIDGQPCTCTQSVHDMQESVQKAAEEKVNETYTPEPDEEVIYEEPIYAEVPDDSDAVQKEENFFTQALEMIKRPSTGFVEAVSDKNSKNGLILMGIEAILTGLYLYVLLQKIVSATMSGINSVFGTSRTTAQTPSLGGFFGYGVIIALIVSLVVAALAMGLMKAMAGADINWFQSCQIAGMRSLGLSLGWILGILGLFLGMYQFAILIIAIGGVLGMIYMIVALMSYPNTKKDRIAYIVLIIALVAAFVAYFVLKEFVLSSLINNGGSTTNFLNNIL